MYDNASNALDHLMEIGAVDMAADLNCYPGMSAMANDFAYDYWDYAPENKAPKGRCVFPVGSTGYRIGAGAQMVHLLLKYVESKGVPILYEHRVEKLLTNDKGAVIGLLARTSEDKVIALRGRRGVHFGSGGFLLNRELRENFQRGPLFGSCGISTNQGDFVHMATEVGAKLGNMQNGWRFHVVLDQALQMPGAAADVWPMVGDSMLVVNKYGQRVVNEKRPYSDRGEVHFDYDSSREEWKNLVLFQIFDQRTRDLCADIFPVPAKGTTAPYLITAATLPELAAAISKRLSTLSAGTGGFKLADDFTASLSATVSRFNQFATSGKDLDFQRGDYRYDVQWNERNSSAEVIQTNRLPNKTMCPLSPSGPYYAILLAAGSADTNGGPVINDKAQVMSVRNQPIPGLYGAGNCIASPSGRAYWGGGGTIGPALVFGYIAAKTAAGAPVNI
jgi:3-oxosteroid 1-dehydrogenase